MRTRSGAKLHEVTLHVLMLVLTVAAGGCTQLQVGHKSPLSPPVMNTDSVAVDIFFVRVRYADPIVEKLWKNVDEQAISAETRKELYRNGFRTGRIAGPLPPELADLLRLTDAPLNQDALETIEEPGHDAESAPVRRHLQTKPHQRAELLASSVYDELPLLRRDSNGQVIGQTVYRAQGVFAMTLSPKPDGTVCIQLVPEVHYGEPRVQPVATEGLVRWEMRRDRIVLNDLTIKLDLAPGDMLVVTCAPDQPGSLGGRFFTVTSSGKREQKLIAIRLSQVQNNPNFQGNALATAQLR
ncbi:hypothetical protein [Thermogutta sp.]|uniref:hypothetical protein n=1 Tax=Thermogutta sp. TaxID=1962930 RepID=UPI003C7AE0CB